jgi:outer membrane protein assembly complex protein YaeT
LSVKVSCAKEITNPARQSLYYKCRDAHSPGQCVGHKASGNEGNGVFHRSYQGLNQRKLLLKRYTPCWTMTILLTLFVNVGVALCMVVAGSSYGHAKPQQSQETTSSSAYEGQMVQSVQLPGVRYADREHLIQLLPQKAGTPLDRNQVRNSIRALFATGRFADIQAEAIPSGAGIVLTFATSPNFFVGALDVEGAPSRPNRNQIVNASKFQLGELNTREKLDRALENIRRLMQDNGYYRAKVTAESMFLNSTQQVSILFHVAAGDPAHVGEVKVTGTSGFSSGQVQDAAHMRSGDRITAGRITSALQRLRKKFSKQQRVLARVSIAVQQYHPEKNSVDYTLQIEPGPVVLITTQGFKVRHGILKKEIPVYEENALDDDLLSEGKRNLLDYLQTKGHFDAKVEIDKQNGENTVRVIYKIDPGPFHRLALIEVTGNKKFLDTKSILSRLEIQPATRFVSHGRYSAALLKNDVANLEGLYRSNGFRQVQIQTKVDDNYKGVENRLAVHIHIDEGPQTLVGDFRIVGNHAMQLNQFPELNVRDGQPYSEQNLASDRESILNFYFNRGFPNATLDITAQPSSQPNREDVTYTIQEGERFSVNHVIVAGREHTRSYVVDRELQVHAGDPLSQQDLLDTQSKLYNLGIFSEVDTAVQNPEGTDPEKNVLVQVQEAKRYTFTYEAGLEFETGLPAGTSSPTGETGVSPRVGFDVTRLNVGGRDQTLTFQSHVGRLQQRGLISYAIPKLFDNEKFKLIFTIFYDNSLDVSTFTSQRLEGKIDLRQQISKPTSITYRFDYRRVKASHFASDFSSDLVPILSLPAIVGGPGFTFIHDRRDNPLESTKGDYFTLDAFAASSYFGSESDFGRALAQNSTYKAFGGKGKPNHQFVFARSTTIGLEQPVRGTKILPPGSCPLNAAGESTCAGISLIPLPEQFFAGGGNSHRGFGLNQAGPRDPDSGFPVGGTALFINSLELRSPPVTLPVLGEGWGFAIFHDMGNVYTAGHDMVKGLLRWHQPNPGNCVQAGGSLNSGCLNFFNNSGFDYTSHAVGMGVRYKTPIGPLRFDFGYNLNPTEYLQSTGTTSTGLTTFGRQRLGPFNVFFSIGQPF